MLLAYRQLDRRQRNKHADKRTNRGIESQSDMQTGRGTITRQADRQIYRLTERKGQAGWQTDRMIYRLTDGQTGTEAGRHTQVGRLAGREGVNRQRRRQSDKQTGTQSDIPVELFGRLKSKGTMALGQT